MLTQLQYTGQFHTIRNCPGPNANNASVEDQSWLLGMNGEARRNIDWSLLNACGMVTQPVAFSPSGSPGR